MLKILHEVDHTELLADCKPNYGGMSEARRLRADAENLGKVSSLDAVCEKLIGELFRWTGSASEISCRFVDHFC